MKRLLLAALMIMVVSDTAGANWRVYRKDKSVIASVNYLSYASFRGQPSVWVRWHHVNPRKGKGGEKIQFTAKCSERRLFEIAYRSYDTKGNYIISIKNFDSPKEYTVTPHSLNEATINLLCR